MLRKVRGKNADAKVFVGSAEDVRKRIEKDFRGFQKPNEADVLADIYPKLDEIANSGGSYTFSGWAGSGTDWATGKGLSDLYQKVAARFKIDIDNMSKEAHDFLYAESGKMYGLYFELAAILDDRSWNSFKLDNPIRVRGVDQYSTLYTLDRV